MPLCAAQEILPMGKVLYHGIQSLHLDKASHLCYAVSVDINQIPLCDAVFVAVPGSLWLYYRVSEEKKRILKYFSENSGLFPLRIGDELDTNTKIQMVLYLVSIFHVCSIYTILIQISSLNQAMNYREIFCKASCPFQSFELKQRFAYCKFFSPVVKVKFQGLPHLMFVPFRQVIE